MGGAGAGTFHLGTGNTVWFGKQERRKQKFQLSNFIKGLDLLVSNGEKFYHFLL